MDCPGATGGCGRGHRRKRKRFFLFRSSSSLPLSFPLLFPRHKCLPFFFFFVRPSPLSAPFMPSSLLVLFPLVGRAAGLSSSPRGPTRPSLPSFSPRRLYGPSGRRAMKWSHARRRAGRPEAIGRSRAMAQKKKRKKGRGSGRPALRAVVGGAREGRAGERGGGGQEDLRWRRSGREGTADGDGSASARTVALGGDGKRWKAVNDRGVGKRAKGRSKRGGGGGGGGRSREVWGDAN